MDETLKDKVVAITGAASGIGLACARRALAAGATVVLVDRAEDRLAELRAELGAKAHAVVVDLLDPKSVERMLPQILEQTGRLDVFHANAGSYVAGDVVDGDPDAWDRMLGLNVNAVFRTVHAVLPHMVERGDRRHRRHQLRRRPRPGHGRADLHRLQARGAGLRPHRPPPGRLRAASA